MKEGPDIARVAALIGEPARANILTALMAGKALTVTELAQEAGITLQTASEHLAKLETGGLVRPRRQGRHKYFALAGDEVAHVLEALMGLAAGIGHLRTRPGPRDAALRRARICYNHLAGDAGVRMYASLMAGGFLHRGTDGPVLTPAGRDRLSALGLDLEALGRGRGPICRDCLDWSERRSHLGGPLGRALLARMLADGWVQRDGTARGLRFTEPGEAAFAETFPPAF